MGVVEAWSDPLPSSSISSGEDSRKADDGRDENGGDEVPVGAMEKKSSVRTSLRDRFQSLLSSTAAGVGGNDGSFLLNQDVKFSDILRRRRLGLFSRPTGSRLGKLAELLPLVLS